MVFWAIVLLVSLATVVGVGAPLMRGFTTKETSNTQKRASSLKLITIALLAAAPIAAALIYLSVGAPYSLAPAFERELAAVERDSAEAIAAMSPEDRVAMIDNMVSGLAARLQEDPTDVQGWRMLARSYDALGRATDSVNAYRELVSRDPDATADDWRNYATAMLAARGSGPGPYSDAFLEALEKLQAFNQDDPSALFYLGLVARENGDPLRALGFWRRLITILPENAPIRPQLQDMIDQAETAAAAQ